MANLEEILGYTFQNKALLEQALTHSSITGDVKKNYERLEFLGDRVLGVSMAHLLYFTFQNEPEGFLSPRFVKLVRKETVAEVALELKLNDYIKANPKSLSTNENVLCDVMEAVIGAVCLDGGFETAIAFVDRHFKKHIEKSSAPERDNKTVLQELAHRIRGGVPVYEVIKKEGTEHEPMFYIKVMVEGKGTAVGKCKNKKMAEQEAAAELLKILEKRHGKQP
ncbi:MAG: ribonuclease III [Alphaproteobacteria bacterium]|nr:ribonuclease III [Alphaproteobacteria bacterium]